jgi:chromate reductase
MRILGISGSLRRDSHNARLLQASRALLPEGVELELFDDLAGIPPFSEDFEHTPPASVIALRHAIAGADAVLLATPEYNGSLPGQLKNALDWVSRPAGTSPLRGKPVAVVGASTGSFGAVWAQAEARKVLGLIGARVLDRELPVPRAHEALADDGLPQDEDVRDALAQLLADLHLFAQPHAIAA